jgi:isoleucyl-tRNA synthetase
MSIGPKVLDQASESLRKIRNSARFMLGNIGDPATHPESNLIPKNQLGLVRLDMSGCSGECSHDIRSIVTLCISFTSSSKLRCVVMHNIISQKVSTTPFGDQIDLTMLPVISTLTNFTNITLSSLYFDIAKDNLYANKASSPERRSTVTVFQHVRRDRELRVL